MCVVDLVSLSVFLCVSLSCHCLYKACVCFSVCVKVVKTSPCSSCSSSSLSLLGSCTRRKGLWPSVRCVSISPSTSSSSPPQLDWAQAISNELKIHFLAFFQRQRIPTSVHTRVVSQDVVQVESCRQNIPRNSLT